MAGETAVTGALAALKANQPQEAVRLLQTWVRDHPGDGVAWGLLGIALSQAGHPASARDAFERSLAAAPQDARLRFNYAMALERAGDCEAARRQYAECVRLDPSHAKARERLAALGGSPPASASPAVASPTAPAGPRLLTEAVAAEEAIPVGTIPVLPERGLGPARPAGEIPIFNPNAAPAAEPPTADAAPRPVYVPCTQCHMHSRPGLVCEWCGAPLGPPPQVSPSRTPGHAPPADEISAAAAVARSPLRFGELLMDILRTWGSRIWTWATLLIFPNIASYLIGASFQNQLMLAAILSTLVQIIFVGAILAGAAEELTGGDAGVMGSFERFVPNLLGFVPTYLLYSLVIAVPAVAIVFLGGLQTVLGAAASQSAEAVPAQLFLTILLALAWMMGGHVLLGPALVMSAADGIHMFEAFGRAWRLTDGLRLRHLGVYFITGILTLVAAVIISVFWIGVSLAFASLMAFITWPFLIALSIGMASALPFIATAGCYIDAVTHKPEEVD